MMKVNVSNAGILRLILMLFLTGNNLLGQDSGAVTEFDPTIEVNVDVNRRIRFVFIAGREKSEELRSSKQKYSAAISFRMKPRIKTLLDNFDTDKQHVLVVGVGYEYSRQSDNRVESVENRLMLDATVRYDFPGKVLLNDRSRFEFRWIEDNYRFRYRNRLMFERKVKLKKQEFTPYGSAEAFLDGHYDKWNKFEFGGGVEVPFTKYTALDLSYQRQRCVTCADPNTNIFGVKLIVLLGKK